MTTISLPYLGKPGAMQKLPSPNGSVTAAPSLGETVHTTLSGAQAVTARLHAKLSYSLPFDHLEPDDADLILGFYRRLYGFGPFVFVDPSVRNRLGFDTSTLGMRSQAPLEWAQSSGVLTRTTGGPVTDSGVLTWSTLTASATLQPGLAANTANVAKAPAYLPSEPCTVSMWVKASSATTASLQLTGYGTAGAVLVTSAATSMAVTTAWQSFTVTIAAGAAAFASAFYVLPRIVLGGTVPTSVSIAGAQLEYADAATSFQPGAGAPRVNITTPPGREVPQIGYSNHTFVLGEA